ncbi:unnamed protein product [Moneuplotes crassus]|uniref:Uncharacterized protein n=1 Tax=Euplotes crassus TaxID=5936 RepID=A0AAD1Y1F9_EUPCR|nr:unnamed protein product [Moneuplotes crassus]
MKHLSKNDTLNRWKSRDRRLKRKTQFVEFLTTLHLKQNLPLELAPIAAMRLKLCLKVYYLSLPAVCRIISNIDQRKHPKKSKFIIRTQKNH